MLLFVINLLNCTIRVKYSKCHVKFESNDRLKCKNLDHDHYTNKYRSASCTMCNLLNRSQNHIPIYFHNFCSYDSKLLLNVINKYR